MQTLIINAYSNKPIDSTYPAELAQRLGSRPRRLSRWAEIGLLGALRCLENQPQPGSDIPIRIFTRTATLAATQEALQQAAEHLPMPFTFMQTQPGQLFNALGSALGWHGDGATVSGADPCPLLLAAATGPILLGWVDELPDPVSAWLLLAPAQAPENLAWQPLPQLFAPAANSRYLRFGHQLEQG